MRGMLKTVGLMAGAAAFGLALSGCADEKQLEANMADADAFGHAVREDLAAQILNPDVAYHAPPPAANGRRVDLAVTHYVTDTVKAPSVSSTTSGISGGGSGGGGGGSQ
jgi:hypothetical protein